MTKNKYDRLKALNKISHYMVLQTIRRSMVKIMFDFDYITKKESFDLLENAEDKFKDFMNDTSIKSRIENLYLLNDETLLLLEKLNKSIKESTDMVLKAMKDIKPYPDPMVVHKITMPHSYETGSVSVGAELLSLILKKLPKEISKEEIDKATPGLEVLWKLMVNGFGDQKGSYQKYYHETFILFDNLAKRAKEENLFFDV